jgi:hypothetical protein
MAGKFCLWPNFHVITGFFNMPQICDMGQTALLPFWRKARWGFFRSKKSDGFGRVWTRKLGYQRYLRLCGICSRWRNMCEVLLERSWWREPEVLDKEKLSHCPFVHDKSHMDWPRIKPEPLLSGANDQLPELWHGLTHLGLYTYLMKQNHPVEVTSSSHQ